MARGDLTRSGRFSVYYHAHNETRPTAPMIENLERLGWIDWQGDKAVLTTAGRRAYELAK